MKNALTLRLTTLVMSLFCFAIPVLAQEKPDSKKYELRGGVQDQNSTVFPGLRLRFKSDKFESNDFADVNGEFHVLLPAGDYVLTADVFDVNEFRGFIRLSDDGLNPNYLTFIVDWAAIDCYQNGRKQIPILISSAETSYPPAARAVRAAGEVTVSVMITQDGRVSSVKAISGHPLLRRASEAAAGKFIFETAKENSEQEAQITFVFLPYQHEKPGIKRFKCPYRIIVSSEEEVIQTTDTVIPSH